MKVSVIIPTYNRAELLARALQSVLRQTCPAHEIIVVDDGSTDETPAVVRQHDGPAKEHGAALVFIQQRQGGAAKARNTGIAASTGDWIAFLDSDDTWNPEKLALQTQAIHLSAGKALACVTDARFSNNSYLKQTAFSYAGLDQSESEFLPGATRRVVYGYHGLYLQALLVNKQLISKIGGFDSEFVLCEDSDFFLRLSLHTPIAVIRRALVEIDRTPSRENGLLELAKVETKRYEIQLKLYEKWLAKYPQLDEECRTLIKKRLHEVHSGLASVYLLNHQFKEARDSLHHALSYGASPKVKMKSLLADLSPSLLRALVVKQRARRAEEHFR